MRRYMNADLNRILKRVPRWILILIFCGIFVLIMELLTDNSSVYEIVGMFEKLLPGMLSLLGLVELLYVYGDDFRAKTLQVAIGTGIKRSHVIMAKWVETVILCVIDYVLILATILICGAIHGYNFFGTPLKDILILMLFGLIQVICCIGFTQIFMFRAQGITSGIFLYLLFDFEIIKTMIELLGDIEVIKPFHISQYLLTNISNSARSRLLVGTFSPNLFLGIAAYCIAFFLIACLVFNKRELDF